MLLCDLKAVLAEAPPTQFSGPAIIQGVQNLTINGGAFNQQVASSRDPELLRKALDFLSLVNFRSIQQDNLGKWTPDTLKWLLEGSMFQWWLETQGAIMWGTGMPGAGKTVLASVMIKHLQAIAQASSDICVAFVYCRYTEPMKVRDILAALVRQLLERFPHLLSVVEGLYAQHSLERTTPTQTELIDVMRKIFGCFRIAYLFVDGLDEALYDEQFDLLDTLKTVPANFFITSRPLVRLKDVLPNVEFFNITAQHGDIQLLVSQHIDRNPDLRQILAAEGGRSEGKGYQKDLRIVMFLHASLMVEAVRHCTTSRRVMEQLAKLPAKLDVLYDQAFKRIEMQPEERAALAKRVLLWVVFAFDSLTVDDLRFAVASDPKVDWETSKNLVSEAVLVSVCCGLITVENQGYLFPSKRTIRLVHYTALDALKRILEQWETNPHRLIAESCVERIMSCGVTKRPIISQVKRLRATLKRRAHPPLLNYARESWVLHAKEVVLSRQTVPPAALASILRFLTTQTTFSPLSMRRYNITWDALWQSDNPTAPIHLVVHYQLPALIPLVQPQVNERTNGGRSALSLAAWQNDAVMAERLLKLDGIEVNLQDAYGETALMHAAGSGSAAVVKVLLLDPRIDIQKRNKKGETALHCALDRGISDGHTESALQLIATPAIDINAADNRGRIPLVMAHMHPPKLLDSLAQHPDIEFLQRDKDGLTPLTYACRGRPGSAVQWYLRLPGMVARDHLRSAALSHRAQQRNVTCLTRCKDDLPDVRALADAGLDVYAKDSKGFTALTYAVQDSQTSIARVLLQLEGVDINLEDKGGRTLLMVACDAVLNNDLLAFSELQTLGLLLQHPSLKINAQNRDRTTAVEYAVARGVLATAADVFSFASHGCNALPARSGSRQEVFGWTGPLHEVPQLAVEMRIEEYPGNHPAEMLAIAPKH
ncbi:hypothetical protein BKA70DRAFT_1427290 [Coprinopsis sp. MPI-PUGE-AT-0042]|nr:hypothetical protein BKA70DRAFT_1427290 [Coprinopsis sp. MPI-PUGE-AT-0042]